MYAEILLNVEVRVDADGLVAEGADIDLVVLLLIGGAVVRLDGGVVGTVDLCAVFASDGQPIFLLADLEAAVFAYVLIEHLK